MLFRSTDSGKNFTLVLDSSGNSTPMLYDRKNNLVICTGWVPSIYFSSDKGQTWVCQGKYEKKEREEGFYACTILQHENSKSTRYLLGCNNPARILATDDSGGSWRIVYANQGIEGSTIPQVVSDRKKKFIYACSTIDVPLPEKLNLFRSADGGEHWEELQSPFNLWVIACDSSNESRIWIGQFEPRFGKNISPIYESSKFGDGLRPLGVVSANLVWRLEVSPNGKQLFAATDKGLLRRHIN